MMQSQESFIVSSYFAPRGHKRMFALGMQLAQQYLTQFGNLAKQNNTMIIPSDLADVAGVLKACSSIIKKA